MKNSNRKHIDFIWLLTGCCLIATCFLVFLKIFNSYYFVEELYYDNVEFTYDDDYDRYEIRLNDLDRWVLVSRSQTKLFYSKLEDFNFLTINHMKRVKDGLDKYEVREFYINIGYEGDSE